MKFPLIYEDKLLVLDETKPIAIACMWSVKEKILDELSELSKEKICLIGNTYSINAPIGMIINLMANRSIRHIIITGDVISYQSIVDRLIEIFCTDEFHPYMDLYLDLLPILREQIKTCEYVPLENLNEFIHNLKPYNPLDVEPIDVKERLTVLPVVTEYPTNQSGYTVHCYDGDLYNTFLDICQLINTRGYTISNTREINNLVVVCHLIDESSAENVPNISKEQIVQYKQDILNPICPPNLSYTYGSLVMAQSDRIIKILKKDSVSRHCYVPLFSSVHFDNDQPPCAVALFFRIINKQLNLTVFFRSNDMFKAWVLNVLAFRTFQTYIGEKLEMKLGKLTTIGCSSHIYSDDFINFECLLKSYTKKSIIPEPEGYYTIDKPDDIDTIIRVKHFSNDHLFITEWSDSDYERLIEHVSSFIQNPQHAAYIGKEVTKIHFTRNVQTS